MLTNLDVCLDYREVQISVGSSDIFPITFYKKTQIPFENNWKPIEITEQVVLIITLQIMQMKNNVFRNYVYEL